jgi:hypothetical protein
MWLRLFALFGAATLVACGESTGPTPVDASDLGGADCGCGDAPPGLRACDVIMQDCPAGQKCTVTFDGMDFGEYCLAITGSVPLDGACVTAPGLDGVGHDDCAAGLTCAMGQCRPFCDGPGACASGQGCGIASDEHGVCLDRCDLFVDGACPAGNACDLVTGHNEPWFGFCRPIGPRAAGEACSPDARCQADLTCSGVGGPPTCHPQCDDTHPCTTGTCWRPPNNPELGYCL